MKGILGRKLGMTQVFDPESGQVTAVTVIEAGPCPVVQIKTNETDGYEAVQLAFDEVAERKLSKGELGHLAKAGAAPHRHLVELRGQSELQVGESVTVEAFEPGEKVKVAGISIGKGFQGTIKRHNFHRGPVSHGSHNVRKPGSIGASATPARVFKGQKMAGRMGGVRVTQPGLVIHQVDAGAEPAARQGRRPGPEERDRGSQGGVVVAAPKAKLIGGKAAKDVTLDAEIFGADVKPHLVHETVRAELNARRAGTRGAKTRGLVAGGRAKPWRQKGTGRARAGTIRAPQFTGGGVVFAPVMRSFDVKVNRKARRSALRGALSHHAANGTLGVLDGSGFESPSTKQAKSTVESWGKDAPLLLVLNDDEETLIKSFRNLPKVLVTVPSELEVATVVWAKSMLISEAALPLVQGRAT